MGETPPVREKYLLIVPAELNSNLWRSIISQPSEVWSNHDSYFKSNPASRRVGIREAIAIGPKGLGEFFAAGADPQFQYIEHQTEKSSSQECSDVDRQSIRFTEDDEFVRVRFQPNGGQWEVVREKISAPEAFAFMLTDNRLSDVNLQVIKATVDEPVTLPCNSREDFQKLWKAVEEIYAPLKEKDPNSREVYQAVQSTLNAAYDGWGVTVTLAPEFAKPLLATFQNRVDQMQKEMARAYQQLNEILEKAKKLIREDDHYERSGKQLLAKNFRPLQEMDLEELTEEIGRLDSAIRYLFFGPSVKEFIELSAQTYSLQIKTDEWAKTYPLFESVVNQLKTAMTNTGQIDFKLCRERDRCEEIQSPEKNRWLEGKEIIDFAKAFYRVVLPAIEDPAKRAAVRLEVEQAFKEAGNLEAIPFSHISAETGNLIRTIIRSKVERLSTILPEIYQEVLQARQLAEALPIPEGFDRKSLPSVPSLDKPEVSTPADLLETTGALILLVRSKVPIEGPSEGARRFMDSQLLPLHQRLQELSKYYSATVATDQYLQSQPEGEIQFMALGGVRGSGGFFPDLKEVAIDLPTSPLENGVEISVDGIAKLDLEEVDILDRDLEVLVHDWKKRGLMDIQPPRFPARKNVGSVRYGSVNVPLNATSDVRLQWSPAELAKILQESIQNVSNQKMFGKPYFSALAQRGVREIVILPSSYFEQEMRAQASALAREAAKIFSTNPTRALQLFKSSAIKFGYVPAGLYEAGAKRILLNAQSLDQLERESIAQLFLHENGHADESARHLPAGWYSAIDAAQNSFIAADEQTVSNHPEVVNRSKEAAAERRADGYAYMLGNPGALRSIDPDLYNYFFTLNRRFEEREVKLEQPVQDGNGWGTPEKVIEKGELARLVYRGAFDPQNGALVVWMAEHPYWQTSEVDCLTKAGDENRWLKVWEEGCQLYEGK